MVQAHKCACGSKVDEFGRQRLSCVKAFHTNPRHMDQLNDLIQRALKSAEVPCKRDPSAFSRPDGKKPDGLTLVPWAKDESLL